MKRIPFLPMAAVLAISSLDGLAASSAYPPAGVPELRLIWSRVADLGGELGSVECAEFSPDGSLIASCTKFSKDIAVWRTTDGTQVWSYRAEQEVERVMFSPDGKLLAAGGEDSVLRVFDAATGKLLFTRPHSPGHGIDAVRWSPDGKLLACGEESSKVRLWRMPAGEAAQVLDIGQGTANEIDFTADGRFMVVIGNKQGAPVWRMSDMSLVRTLQGDKGETVPIITVRISRDDRFVAAGDYGGRVFIWDLASGKLLQRLNYTGQKIETVCFSPDSQYLLLAGHEPHIRVLRTSDWAVVHLTEFVDNLEHMVFSANGSFLVSAHQDGIIRLWVWMRGDPNLNTKLHEALKVQQAREDAEVAKKSAAKSR